MPSVTRTKLYDRRSAAVLIYRIEHFSMALSLSRAWDRTRASGRAVVRCVQDAHRTVVAYAAIAAVRAVATVPGLLVRKLLRVLHASSPAESALLARTVMHVENIGSLRKRLRQSSRSALASRS